MAAEISESASGARRPERSCGGSQRRIDRAAAEAFPPSASSVANATSALRSGPPSIGLDGMSAAGTHFDNYVPPTGIRWDSQGQPSGAFNNRVTVLSYDGSAVGGTAHIFVRPKEYRQRESSGR